MTAAARERLPDEREGRLLAGIPDPTFEQPRSYACLAVRGTRRPAFEQHAPVAVIADQICQNRDDYRQRDGEHGVASRVPGTLEDGFPRTQEPYRRPPGGSIRLAADKRQQAERGDKHRSLHEERSAREQAARQDIEQ